jgi:hypothetical protein
MAKEVFVGFGLATLAVSLTLVGVAILLGG